MSQEPAWQPGRAAAVTSGAVAGHEVFVQRVHFGCSRCGACCNSAPQLSLPELFRHQTTFVGCLGIRRLRSPETASDGRALELDAFLPRFAERVTTGTVLHYVSITAQAYDDPLMPTCSALTKDKLCSLQDTGKPLACRSVPFEAALPDAFQLGVLRERAREAEFMGANCIELSTRFDPAGPDSSRQRSSARSRLPLVVEGFRIVDPEARRDLELRRAALRLDKRYWGERVFEMLRRDLFEQPERVPEEGYVCLSLAPALSVISAISNALGRRVVEYLNAQIELIALTLGAPVGAPTQAQRELAGMLRANLALREKLQTARALPQSQPNAFEVEAWLAGRGLEAPLG